jgi:hypothetical protein
MNAIENTLRIFHYERSPIGTVDFEMDIAVPIFAEDFEMGMAMKHTFM